MTAGWLAKLDYPRAISLSRTEALKRIREGLRKQFTDESVERFFLDVTARASTS